MTVWIALWDPSKPVSTCCREAAGGPDMPGVWWEATSQHPRHQKGWTVLGDERMPTNVVFCPFCGVSLPERPGV